MKSSLSLSLVYNICDIGVIYIIMNVYNYDFLLYYSHNNLDLIIFIEKC